MRRRRGVEVAGRAVMCVPFRCEDGVPTDNARASRSGTGCLVVARVEILVCYWDVLEVVEFANANVRVDWRALEDRSVECGKVAA
jgi:hypothetical protein